MGCVDAHNNIKARKIDDGVLLVVLACIYGHLVHVLIDSGAIRCFISLEAIAPLGLQIVKENTFLELGTRYKVLFCGKV